MKIRGLFKKAAATLMAAVTALSILPATTAFAAGDIGTISFSHTYDSSGNAMRYNSSATFDGHTAGGTGNYKYRMFVDGENAFCIQPGVPLKTGNTLKQASSDTWNALSANQKKAVGLALLYGYQGNRSNLTGSDDEKWVATQTLVWEFVTGCREATGPFSKTNDKVYSLHFGSNYANSGAKAAYDQIVSLMSGHHTIPSFMSGSKNGITKELAYKDGKYTLTFTDSNGVLSDYAFSSSDSKVSVSKSGNKLTISSAKAFDGTVRITATRNNVPTVSSSAKLIAYGDPNLQDLVTGVENADTVAAYINVETPTGTIALKKMSKYSFSDSIRDNATLPLNFEPVPIDLHVDKEKLDQAFDEMTDGLSDEDKGELSKNVTMKAIMYDRKRIKKVVEHIVNHYKTKIEPNGYKAQIVVYDRECCLMYKEELDKLVPPESSTIVMTTGDDKAGRYKQYKRSRDEEAKVLDQFREPSNPLKFVIVTNKLLTGFDAPILQVMYLDKPMKDHNLLQAICRVNRTYDVGKTNGLIVDYIGIFDNVAKALNFDEAGMKKVVTNIEEVKKQVPAIMRKCLSYFMGVDRTVEGWEGLLAAQECMPNNKIKDEFAADYRVLNRAWNALSPDPFLEPFKYDYVWLSKVYESVKPTDSRGQLVWAALGAKTLELVHQHIEVGEVHDDVDILTLDAALIDEFIEKQKDIKKTTMKVEIDLVAKIQKHSHAPKFQKLGEKLEELREKHEQGLVTSIEFLKLLLELAKEAVRAEKEVVPEEEIDRGKAALTELFNGLRNDKTPVIVERIVSDIDDIVKIVRFDGWQKTTTGKNEVKKALRSVVWIKYKIKDKDVFDKAYSYIEQYY